MEKSSQNNNTTKTSIIFKKLHNAFLDILFPITCIGCKKEGEWICEKCLSEIKTADRQVCPICEKMTVTDGKTCFSCQKISPLNGLLVCASYREKNISKMVHNFKYRFIKDLSVPLGKIMVEKIMSSFLPLPDFIIPVPLHSKRLRWRGFNQSLLLAKQISRELTPGIEIPVLENILERIKHTHSQMKIKNYQDRRKNIKNAFSIKDKQTVTGRIIFLIDDISTTGATIFECAEMLKKYGAKKVFAVVIARQETNVVVHN